MATTGVGATGIWQVDTKDAAIDGAAHPQLRIIQSKLAAVLTLEKYVLDIFVLLK